MQEKKARKLLLVTLIVLQDFCHEYKVFSVTWLYFGNTVVENLTHNQQIKGSNPAIKLVEFNWLQSYC
jgi:hypothetical protein